jgi:hypothetical protein
LISYVINYLKPLYEVNGNRLPRVAPKVPNENIGVQLRKTRDCCIGSRLSEIIIAKEELNGT